MPRIKNLSMRFKHNNTMLISRIFQAPFFGEFFPIQNYCAPHHKGIWHLQNSGPLLTLDKLRIHKATYTHMGIHIMYTTWLCIHVTYSSFEKSLNCPLESSKVKPGLSPLHTTDNTTTDGSWRFIVENQWEVSNGEQYTFLRILTPVLNIDVPT